MVEGTPATGHDASLLTPYSARFWVFYVDVLRPAGWDPVSLDWIGTNGECDEKIDRLLPKYLRCFNLQQLELRVPVEGGFICSSFIDANSTRGIPVGVNLLALEKFRRIAEVRKLVIVLEDLRLSRNECMLEGHLPWSPLLPMHRPVFKYPAQDSLSTPMYHALKEEVLRVGRIIIWQGHAGASFKVTENYQIGQGRRDVIFTFEAN